MIVKTSVAILLISIACYKSAYGAAYSKVFLERDVVPIEYYEYGTPHIANAQFAQLQSAPIQIAVPTAPALVSPCGPPCIVTRPSVATGVAPVGAKTTIVAHKSTVSTHPAVVKQVIDPPPGYEYSYVVYDENTGDHKAQRELSDGNVVRGEYSFIQPDGYVREVKYVADEINGFNAVVKNFLPTAVEGKRVEVVQNSESKPIHEVKKETANEGLKELSEEAPKEKFAKIEVHQSQNKHETPKDSGEETKESEESKEKSKESGEKSKDSEENNKSTIKEPNAESEENSKEKHKEITELESKEDSKEEHHENASKEIGEEESKEKIKEKQHKNPKKESTESSDESKEKHEHKSKEPKEPNEFFTHKKGEEMNGKLIHLEYGVPRSHEPAEVIHDTVVPYQDILRCIQAAIRRANEKPDLQREEPSPLTYIILNRAC